jgi:DNA-binding MarR family transcriptional regulator
MTTTTTAAAGAPPVHDLGSALQALGRALVAIKASPQAFGLDPRVDRAAYFILARLTDAGTARMSELAALLSLDLSTVSRQVRSLEDLDLVGRTPDADDRRAYLLTPTDAGRALVADVKEKFSRLVDVALDDWSERDRKTLTTLLGRLAHDLRPERAPHLVAAVHGATS